MSLCERVEFLGSSLKDGVADRLNQEWFKNTALDIALILPKGIAGSLVPSNFKTRYFEPLGVDLEKMQRSAEVWLFALGAASIYLAASRGIGFNNSNRMLRTIVRGGSAVFIGSVITFAIDNSYRLLAHHDKKPRKIPIPVIHRFFDSIGYYNKKPYPGSAWLEIAYKLIVEKGLKEERVFSKMDSLYSRLTHTQPCTDTMPVST